MLSGNKKYANEILDDIECYKAVLDGRLKRFPRGFWTKPWSQQSAAVITRYLLEDRLNYTEDDIKTKVDVKVFSDNKLLGLLDVLGRSPYQVINNAYPDKFKPWEIKQSPLGFWEDKENVKQAVRWLVENKLDNNRERVCKEFNQNLINKHGMRSISKYGIYNVLNMTYPNEFKPWELSVVASNFWSDGSNLIDVVKWLVETKLDNNRERVCREFNTSLFDKYGVGSVASRYGIYRLLNMAYPNEFKPWELSVVPNGFWEDKNNIIEAVKWAVETKLDNNRDRVCKEFNQEFIVRNKLATLSKYGIHNIINMAYPNEFKPWELSQVPDGFWEDDKNIVEAVKWLVETKLGNNKERVRKEFTREFLINNGLSSLASMGLFKILDLVYPNEFKASEFKSGMQK